MINKAKNVLKNNDTKTLLSNFSYMSIIELSNYILPFIAIPYIVRVIGVEKYGIIMFAYAVMVFFEIIINWGFKYLAPKYISINRDNINKISSYFWEVIVTQLFLLALCFIVFLMLLFNLDKFNQETTVFLYSFLMVVGNILFPIWFFQGIEKMKYVAIFNVVSRVIYTVMIFIFVNHADDYALVPLFNSLSLLLIGFFSLFFIQKEFGISFIPTSIYSIKQQLIEGWHLFLAALSSNLYTTINTILLGFLTTYSVVGVLSLAVTISGGITKIIKIYSNVTFPYMAKFSEQKDILIKKAKLLLKIYSSILLITGLATLLSASTLIPLIFGEGKSESILLLQILAVVIIIEPLGGFFTAYLVLKDQGKTVSKITFYTMIVNFIIIIPAIILFQAIGVVAAKLLVEGFHVIMNIKYNKELFTHSSKEKHA